MRFIPTIIEGLGGIDAGSAFIEGLGGTQHLDLLKVYATKGPPRTGG